MRKNRNRTTWAAVTSLAGLITALAAAGVPDVTITSIVLEGDTVPGVGLVTRIDNIAVNNSGVWLVEADTDNPDTDADSVLLKVGTLLLREGQALADPPGASIDSFDSIVINNAEDSMWNFFLSGTKGLFDDSGVYFNTGLLIQEGDESTAAGFSEGTIFVGFFDVKVNDSARGLIVASVDDPAIPSSVDRALMVVNAADLAQVLIAKEGDVLPGQKEPVADFGTGPHASAFNNSGHVLYFADLAGDTAVDGAIYLYDALEHLLLAQEGSPSPVKGRNWSNLVGPELDLNNVGGHVYSGLLDGDTNSNSLIVRNGEKFMQEGDPVPGGIAGGFVLTGFGTGPLEIDDQNRVLWFGTWNDPNTDVNKGLFLDETLLVQEGVTVIDGQVVDMLRGVEDGYHMSSDGRYVIFEAVLVDGTEGAFLIEVLEELCPWDINGNGNVEPADLAALLDGWGPNPGHPADFNADGEVGPPDLAKLLDNWGPCP